MHPMIADGLHTGPALHSCLVGSEETVRMDRDSSCAALGTTEQEGRHLGTELQSLSASTELQSLVAVCKEFS